MRKKRLWSNSEVKGYSRREFVGKIAGLSAVASLGGVFRPIFALANPNAAYPPRIRLMPVQKFPSELSALTT